MVSSLRLKKCHWPTLRLLIRPARCRVARCADSGLRQAATLIDLPGANAVLVAVGLVWKFDGRVFEPVQDVSADRVRQGFYYFVEVKVHGWGLVISKTLYRDEANFKSVFRDIPI
jgi:hypothetical protein